jgi:hypothetical protein
MIMQALKEKKNLPKRVFEYTMSTEENMGYLT